MERSLHIGIDTSCYTTSIACVSGKSIVFERRTVLCVAQGARGLRQSDAVFAHVRGLPSLLSVLFCEVNAADIRSVAVSARPTDAADSYMPAFLTGRLAAETLAGARGVPLFETSHQAGHIRAALFGNERLLAEAHLYALHLSGGTSDVLDVRLADGTLAGIERTGGSDDLHAGQFVDRVGVSLGLPFPCGRHLEALAREAVKRKTRIPTSVRGLACSFSGAESAAQRLITGGECAQETAYAVYDCLARTVARLIDALPDGVPVLLCGGVASSGMLRELIAARTARSVLYGQSALSSDNAVGTALLGQDRWEAHP